MLPTPLHRLPVTAQKMIAVKKNESIFLQGAATEGLYFVERGSVELRRHTESGAQVVIHRAVSGETFAEASLFSNVYHCDAVALDETVVVRIARKAV